MCVGVSQNGCWLGTGPARCLLTRLAAMWTVVIKCPQNSHSPRIGGHKMGGGWAPVQRGACKHGSQLCEPRSTAVIKCPQNTTAVRVLVCHKMDGELGASRDPTFWALVSPFSHQKVITFICVGGKQEIQVIIQHKHFCLLDFSLTIWKLKHIKQWYLHVCYMLVKTSGAVVECMRFFSLASE